MARLCLSAVGPCARRTGHPFAASSPWGSRRRLSLGSLPVPKQYEVGLGSCLRRPAGDLRDLAACASNNPDVCSPHREGFLRYCRAGHLRGRQEILLSAFHSEHMSHQLASHRQSGPILVPSLSFFLLDQSQFMGVSRR